MKIVVLGSAGMLGSALSRELSKTHDVIGIARKAGRYTHHICDLRDSALWSCLDQIEADVIINTAAITNLMTCHRQIDQAYKLHVHLSEQLAKRVEMNIYVSTDSIFDGYRPPPFGYGETCMPAPLNVYALTKLLGEKPILHNNGLVIRTNIYGFNLISPGNSLFEWIVSCLRQDQPLSGYQNFFFNPVSIFQLSRAIEICLSLNVTGLLNIGSTMPVSKADFMMTVVRFVHPEFSEVTLQDAPEGEIIRPKRTNLDTRRATSLGLPEFNLDEGICETSALYNAIY